MTHAISNQETFMEFKKIASPSLKELFIEQLEHMILSNVKLFLNQEIFLLQSSSFSELSSDSIHV